jgi:hypothetical protein
LSCLIRKAEATIFISNTTRNSKTAVESNIYQRILVQQIAIKAHFYISDTILRWWLEIVAKKNH